LRIGSRRFSLYRSNLPPPYIGRVSRPHDRTLAPLPTGPTGPTEPNRPAHMPLGVSIAIFAVTGLVLAALAVPLARGRVRPNAWYGLRVRATFASERVWYAANRASGRELFALGLALASLSVLLGVLPGIRAGLHGGLMVAATLAGVLATAVVGIVRANRMLAAERRETEGPRP